MDKQKKFDEISIMHVLAMTMIVAFHSMCFYNGRWTKVNAIDIPIWNKASTFLDVIDLNMFVFISGYLYGYLYIYRNKYRHPSEVIRNKAVRLLIPYCFWGIIMVVSFPWNNWTKLLYGVGHLWFLLMLFEVFTMTVLLQLLNAQRVRFTWKLGGCLIVLGYVSYLFSKSINPHDFLCVNPVGALITPDSITHYFIKLLDENELPHIRFHELRHSCISLLANYTAFSVKQVQDYAGHSDFLTTFNVYSHTDDSDKKTEMDYITSCFTNWFGNNDEG